MAQALGLIGPRCDRWNQVARTRDKFFLRRDFVPVQRHMEDRPLAAVFAKIIELDGDPIGILEEELEQIQAGDLAFAEVDPHAT